ncbi:MAG: MBOAT family protein [Lachnospiraceae bacterium]|nr:MBOAT family protein [Lachnospiraceae bacterium]
MSITFYHFAAQDYTIIFLLISAVISYISGILIHKVKINNTENADKLITVVAITSVILNALLWFLLKGSAFWIVSSIVLHRLVPVFPVLSPLPFAGALGMGYYTAQAIGYIMDCYWENIEPQRNFLKLFLFVSFFPQLTVGPISRYSQLESLYDRHSFSYKNLCFASQRILWGLFKKLVISDRTAIIITGIWNNSDIYGGFWPWIALFLYPLQIYTDFSGCVDIVLGAAQLFDIHLAENFDNPFLARNSQEFWQRWHITLGAWARDYFYYPLLKSRFIQAIGKWARKHFPKRIAKLIPWSVGMGILWCLIGIWHGSIRHIIGVSIWYWLVLVAGEFFSPISQKLIEKLEIDVGCFSWHLFQSIRTYVIFSVAALFFAADSLRDALKRFMFLFQSLTNLNPWIFFDGSVTNLNVTMGDINLIIFGVLMMFVVAYLRSKYGYARNWMCGQLLVFRWIVWIALFVIVLIYGLYGPGYDAATFIYEGF